MQWQRSRGNIRTTVCRALRRQMEGQGLIGERPTGQQWQELLAVLFQASQSTNASQREGAFRIFATTPGIIEKQHEDTVLAAFTKGFEDEDVSVRFMLGNT